MRVRYAIQAGRDTDYYYDAEIPFVPDEDMMILDLPAFPGSFVIQHRDWLHREAFLLIEGRSHCGPIEPIMLRELQAAGWKFGSARIDKWERSSLVKAGLQRARNEGKKLGRPRLRINRKSFMRLVDKGASLSYLGRHFGFSKSTAQRYLKKFRKER